MYRWSSVGVSVIALLATSCSSQSPAGPVQGSLASGTFAISINGSAADSPSGFDCTHVDSFTTATAGNDDPRVSAVLNNASGVAPVSVQITNIGGFSGSYFADLQGSAEVTVKGSTFEVSGVADGFYSDRPSARDTGTFIIRFAC